MLWLISMGINGAIRKVGNLNTSYVMVNPGSVKAISPNAGNLNTSYVMVNPALEILNSAPTISFKYILCYG